MKQHNYISILARLVALEAKAKEKEGPHVIREGKYLSHQTIPIFFFQTKGSIYKELSLPSRYVFPTIEETEVRKDLTFCGAE